MEYLTAAYTDQGIKKSTNQDSFCVRRARISNADEMLMIVLCDGMGGLKKGEVASAAAVQAFGTWFDHNLQHLSKFCDREFFEVQVQWNDIIKKLHEDILSYAAKSDVQIGTTLVGILAYQDRYLTVNVGDSRIYERKEKLRRLTEDQSLVAREIALGKITEDESRHHPQRNVLLQCLGAGDRIVPVFTRGELRSEGMYLLCSDGFVHELTSAELEEGLNPIQFQCKEKMNQWLYEMTECCKARGETDNITAVLFKTQESAYTEPSPKAESGGWQRIFPWNWHEKRNGEGEAEREEAPAAVKILESVEMIHTTERLWL